MKTKIELHLLRQQNYFVRLLAKHAVLVEGEWYVPGQVALDIVSGKIKE
jgi:hypothetical protein